MRTNQVEYIRRKKRRGDIASVAEMLGCDSGTIKQMLSGYRSPNTQLGKQVMDALTKVIKTRESLPKAKRKS